MSFTGPGGRSPFPSAFPQQQGGAFGRPGWPAGPRPGQGPPGGGPGFNQPSYGYGGFPPPPPGRGSGAGRSCGVAMLVVIAVLVLGMVLIGVAVAVMVGGGSSSPTTPSSRSTQPVTATTRPPRTPTPARTPTSTPTRTPTTPATADPNYPSPTVTGGEDPGVYDPVTTDNWVHHLDATASGCTDAFVSPTDLADMQRRWTDDLDCYSQAWVRLSGGRMRPSKLTFFDEVAETPCGSIKWYALYCSLSETIYVGTMELEPERRMPIDHWQTVVHEFSHHVQTVSEISEAAWALQAEDRYVYARRVELQAACFTTYEMKHFAGGVFGPRQFDEALHSFRGDETHGSTEMITQWMLVGWNATSRAQCNTWVVPADQVRFP